MLVSQARNAGEKMIGRRRMRGGAVDRPAQPKYLRIGVRGLAILLGVSAAAVVAMVFLAFQSLLPARGAPQATPDQYPRAIAAVREHLTDKVEDPLIEIRSNVFARQSNVMGVEVDGVRYYYAILGHQSFDPVSLGTVQPNQVEVIYRTEGTGFPLVIYYIRQN